MVIFCFPFCQKQRHRRCFSALLGRRREETSQERDSLSVAGLAFAFCLWCLVRHEIFLFIKTMFVSPNDGRRSFLLCTAVHKWTENEFKSDKFQRRRLCHLCLILQSNMIYGINSFSHSHRRRSSLKSQTRIWLSFTLGDDHKVDQTMDHRTPKKSSKPDNFRWFFFSLFGRQEKMKKKVGNNNINSKQKEVSWIFSFLVVFRQWNCTLI